MTYIDADLDMLKAITDRAAAIAESGGRWDAAEEAVSNVLTVLYNTPRGNDLWQPIYEAIKSAYVGNADWGEGDE